MSKKKYLIVGAGITGTTCANILKKSGHDVTIIDKRNHIGGNCYDYFDKDGVCIHPYGPHIFHTDHKEVIDYLGKFTNFELYNHSLSAYIDGKYISLPISLESLKQLGFSKDILDKFLHLGEDSISIVDLKHIKEFQQVYNKIYEGYNKKQRGDINERSLERMKIYFDYQTSCHKHKYVVLPDQGYTAMFNNMLKGCKIMLNTSFKDIQENALKYNKLIWTGPIDEYFNYNHGKLDYIQTQFDIVDRNIDIPTASVTYPNNYDFTRITRLNCFYNNKSKSKYITETPNKYGGEITYPYESNYTDKILNAYHLLKSLEKNVIFTGRLAEFKYMDMDECVKNVLELDLPNYQ